MNLCVCLVRGLRMLTAKRIFLPTKIHFVASNGARFLTGSTPRKIPRGPKKYDAPMPALALLPAMSISIRARHLRGTGGVTGKISILPTGQIKRSGHVNMICCFSPAFRRERNVMDDALAFPAGSKMTATNDKSETGATDVFSAIAIKRGLESTPDICLLLTVITAASFFNRSHTKGSENSK